MTIADMGTRPLIDGTAVDDFRALVARLGVMDTINILFGNGCLDDGVSFPGRTIRLIRCDEGGEERWLFVAGTSAADPWSHVDSAPEWVRDRFDPEWRPQTLAWGKPLSWEVSAGRRGICHDGSLPVVNMQRPWLTDNIARLIEPALTDAGTIKHLPSLFPDDEPDVLAGSDIDELATTVWNSLVSADVTENGLRLAASLRALGTNVQLAPLGLDRVDAAAASIDRLWKHCLPGSTRPVEPIGGGVDVIPRRGDHDNHLIAENTAFMRGWAIEAMREAARGVSVEDRMFRFDEHGLFVRDGDAWARLLGFSHERFVIVASSPEPASERRGSFPRPSWVPDVEDAFAGTAAWTTRGYWRGDGFTGPLDKLPEFSALRHIQPNRSVNLQASLSLVPEPVSAAARGEVLGMMQGMQDFTWNGTVLAVDRGGTPSHYRL